jgi:hypothetical protein
MAPLQMYGDSVHLRMIIRSVRHRGLLRLIEDDDSRELRNDLVRRLRNILTVLIAAARCATSIWRTTTDERRLCENSNGPGAPRPVHP